MITAAAPFLMFQGACEQALTFYEKTVPGARIMSLERKPEGGVARGRLSVAGLEVMAFDSPPVHAFDFTPSFSIFLTVDTAGDVDQLASALGEGGATMMSPDAYDFSRRFGWVQDRFGVSWQINLP